MPNETLNLDSLGNVDRGALRIAVNDALKLLVQDLHNRPTLDKKRTIILKVDMTPVTDENSSTAELDTVDFAWQVLTKAPAIGRAGVSDRHDGGPGRRDRSEERRGRSATMKPTASDERLVRLVSHAGEGEPYGRGQLVMFSRDAKHAAREAAGDLWCELESRTSCEADDGEVLYVDVEDIEGKHERLRVQCEVKRIWTAHS